MTTFRYAAFWRWFKDDPEGVLMPTDDVRVSIYQGVNNRTGHVEPFVKRDVACFQLNATDALHQAVAPVMSLHGIFVVLEKDAFLRPQEAADGGTAEQRQRRRDNALHAKRLYVVFPTWHERPGVLAADHLTCVVNREGDRRPLKLHFTTYVIVRQALKRLPANGYLPLEFEMSRDAQAFARARLHHPDLQYPDMARTVHAVLCRPTTAHALRATAAAAAATAGGGGRAATDVRRSGRRLATTRRHGALTFSELWGALPLQQVRVIAVRRGAVYHVTVDAVPRVPTPPATLLPAATFTLSPAEAEREDAVRDAVARHLSGWAWDDFV